jgi:2-(1,2-epoxy-1,2-dihydrophenyl)acetyl-CoA isomerase
MIELVKYDVREGVAHLELNRPDMANAFDLATADELATAVERTRTDVDVRAVLVTGAGRRFCAGGDVAAFAAAPDQPAYVQRLATRLDRTFRALADLEKPVVAAVHGAVAGAGLALMLSCDVIVASPTTKFVFAYPGIGFTPDCGLSYLLPRAIGQQRALTFSLVGMPATAQEAIDWGLIAEVADDPRGRASDLASGFAAGPATALGKVRRLLRQGWETSRSETGVEEARTIAEMVKGEEAKQLIARFVSR